MKICRVICTHRKAPCLGTLVFQIVTSLPDSFSYLDKQVRQSVSSHSRAVSIIKCGHSEHRDQDRTEDQYIIGKQEQSRLGMVSGRGETMPVTVWYWWKLWYCHMISPPTPFHTILWAWKDKNFWQNTETFPTNSRRGSLDGDQMCLRLVNNFGVWQRDSTIMKSLSMLLTVIWR